jgi:carbonic anhydrase
MDSWINLLAAHEVVRDPGRSLVPEHKPVAAILSCSDARVPPSVIFDQQAGQLFVVRVAGNTATPAAVASLDFAVAELDVPLIVVLGHTNCGAVGAACSGAYEGYLEPLTDQIAQLMGDQACTDVDKLAEHNVLATLIALTDSDSPTGHAIQAGQVATRGAIYDVATDDLRPLTSRNAPPYPLISSTTPHPHLV